MAERIEPTKKQQVAEKPKGGPDQKTTTKDSYDNAAENINHKQEAQQGLPLGYTDQHSSSSAD